MQKEDGQRFMRSIHPLIIIILVLCMVIALSVNVDNPIGLIAIIIFYIIVGYYVITAIIYLVTKWIIYIGREIKKK